jgi:hypothetical protein
VRDGAIRRAQALTTNIGSFGARSFRRLGDASFRLADQPAAGYGTVNR